MQRISSEELRDKCLDHDVVYGLERPAPPAAAWVLHASFEGIASDPWKEVEKYVRVLGAAWHLAETRPMSEWSVLQVHGNEVNLVFRSLPGKSMSKLVSQASSYLVRGLACPEAWASVRVVHMRTTLELQEWLRWRQALGRKRFQEAPPEWGLRGEEFEYGSVFVRDGAGFVEGAFHMQICDRDRANPLDQSILHAVAGVSVLPPAPILTTDELAAVFG